MNGKTLAQQGRPAKTTASGRDILCVNLQAALNLLEGGRPLSSPEIGEQLSVRPATVGRLMNILVEAGLVENCDGRPRTGVGRPPRVWRLNSQAAHIVGLAIQSELLRAIVVNLNGSCTARRTISYDPPLTTETLPHTVSEVVKSLTSDMPPEQIIGVGVGISGVVSHSDGDVLLSGGLSAEVGTPTTGYPLRDELEAVLPWPVMVANDANAGALAVYHHMLRNQDIPTDATLLYLMAVDSMWGFGSGLISRARMLLGTRGAAGEIFHHDIDVKPPPWGDLPRRAIAGEHSAITEVLEHLAPVLEYFAALAMFADADHIVLGGALPQLGQPLLEKLKEVMRTTPGYGGYLADLLEHALIFDPLMPDTIAVGASELVLDDLFRTPTVGAPGPLVTMALAQVS